MTAETIHTCSYSCERPECIRAQRDELAGRLTAETSNARGEWVLVPRELLDEARNIAMEWTLKGRVPECGKFGQIAQDLDAMLAASPQPSAARGDVRYDRELIAQMLDAAEAPAFTMEEMDTQARLLREAAQAKPEARGDGDLNISMLVRDGTWVGTYAEWCQRKQTPTPSAPVGVDGLIEAAKAAESMLRTVHECASHECEDCREYAGIVAKKLRAALAQQPAAVDEAMVDRACDAYVQIADDCMGLVRRKAMRAALTAALAAQHQEPKS